MLQETVEYGFLVWTTATFHIIYLVVLFHIQYLASETVAMTRKVIRRVVLYSGHFSILDLVIAQAS